MKKKLGVAAILAAVFATTTAAQDNDDYAFTLVNHSEVAVTQFNGYAGGRWSSNWLSSPVAPDSSRQLRFDEDSTADCSVRVRVTFADGSYFEDFKNFCGVDFVNVSNDAMWFEGEGAR